MTWYNAYTVRSDTYIISVWSGMYLDMWSVYMLFFVNGHGTIHVCVWYVIMYEYGAICV